MDIEEIKSNLKMKNLYFSKCSIERAAKISNGKLNMSLEKSIEKLGDHDYNVNLQLTVTKEDLELLVIANAQFFLESEDYSNEESIIAHNTVAIMFPYMRSQVSLMTSQSGMQPIILPPINTAKI